MRAPVSVLISGVFSLKIKLEYLEGLSFCRHQNWVAIPELIRFKLSPTLTDFQREGEKTLAVKFSKKLKVQKTCQLAPLIVEYRKNLLLYC